ncbi:hypothetical protein A6A08_16790 [Nocardiopsis sp. TSRI0078]|uniref:hypothetical protein n=1 Tax=unclassified Nocardiopsis TaxID=2649073 RepID=UPI00093ECB15|nr:hypothetical protein [Nocardiopsis sp. TSRI0078]OKI13085.1 hypothetical protein A6A08_16790 [Nocardiopsis sp. TSRI0078]
MWPWGRDTAVSGTRTGSGGGAELLLLDAATGERLDRLPGFVLEEDGTRSPAYGGVVRIGTGGSVVHEVLRDDSPVHRADASGEITATADLGDINAGAVVDDVVALEDTALVPRMRGPLNTDEQQLGLVVAPFGGTVNWKTARSSCTRTATTGISATVRGISWRAWCPDRSRARAGRRFERPAECDTVSPVGGAGDGARAATGT